MGAVIIILTVVLAAVLLALVVAAHREDEATVDDLRHQCEVCGIWLTDAEAHHLIAHQTNDDHPGWGGGWAMTATYCAEHFPEA